MSMLGCGYARSNPEFIGEGKHNQATMGEGELGVRVCVWFKDTLTAETNDGASI